MLFNELDKLKRSAIMTTIVLMFIGHILLVIPESYIPVIGGALGFGLLVTACIVLFHFIGSKKALIHYIELTLGMFARLLGVLIYVFDDLILRMLSVLVTVVPILFGLSGIYHALPLQGTPDGAAGGSSFSCPLRSRHSAASTSSTPGWTAPMP
ncbi:MAG: hypothetical protein IJ055_04770 [Oscillospiraceae bacterium]|nr:hypothetical protein [Oscillospiraceae bacterium]